MVPTFKVPKRLRYLPLYVQLAFVGQFDQCYLVLNKYRCMELAPVYVSRSIDLIDVGSGN